MGALTDFTVYDGEAVPVAHVFYADHVEYTGQDLLALWREVVPGVPEYAQGTAQLSRKKVGSGVLRISFRVNLPVMEAVNGQNLSGYTAAPKVAYVDSNESVQWVHPRSLAQGRQNAKSIVRNIWYNASPASTGAVTTGMAYDAQVRLVFPN